MNTLISILALKYAGDGVLILGEKACGKKYLNIYYINISSKIELYTNAVTSQKIWKQA